VIYSPDVALFELFLKFFALKTLSEFETLKGLSVGENLKKRVVKAGNGYKKPSKNFSKVKFYKWIASFLAMTT